MLLYSNNQFTQISISVLQTILPVTMVENSVKFNNLASIHNLNMMKETMNSRQSSTNKSTKNVIWLQMDSSTCLRVVKVATLHYHNRLGSFNSNSSIPITKTKTTMMGIIKEIFSNKNMIDANKVNAHSKIHTLKFLRPKVLAPTITVSTMRRTIKLRAQVYTTKLSIIINSAISTTLGKTTQKINTIRLCFLLKTINRIATKTHTTFNCRYLLVLWHRQMQS